MEELKCPFYIILIIILAGKVKKMEKKINPSDKPRMDSFLVNSNTEHLINETKRSLERKRLDMIEANRLHTISRRSIDLKSVINKNLASVIIGIVITLVITYAFNFLIEIKSSQGIQDQKIENLINKVSSQEISIEKKFDKVDVNFDRIANKIDNITEILIKK